MISPALVDAAACPDCGARFERQADTVRCTRCGRSFPADGGFLDLQPLSTYAERTKYLDHELHVDGRHESIAPPVLGSRIRNDMLRAFLAPSADDRIIDLGCGSGRTLVWNGRSGAWLAGIDISPFFAAEAIAQVDLIRGDLRRLPLRSGAFNKAWSLDVLEHLSPDAFRDMLGEAHRVLADGGALFVYTHVRTNGWPAAGVRLVNRLARLCERLGWLDLRQERLRKSDHLNPITTHEELRRVVGECGFAVERITYYSPVIGAFMENVLARLVEQRLARRAAHTGGPATADDAVPVRAARAAAQARVARRGAIYRGLLAATALMKLDLFLFGRVQSGPFFALLRKQPAPTAGAERAAPNV